LKIRKWTFKKHLVLSVVLTAVTALDDILIVGFSPLWAYFNGKMISMEAASVGIIGGADGPTAVFVADKVMDGHINSRMIVFLVYLMLYHPTKKMFDSMSKET